MNVSGKNTHPLQVMCYFLLVPILYVLVLTWKPMAIHPVHEPRPGAPLSGTPSADDASEKSELKRTKSRRA